MSKIISVLLVISLVLLIVVLIIDFVYTTKALLRMRYKSYDRTMDGHRVNGLIMSKPEYSTLVESYKEGYRYVVKDAYTRKLIFFKEEPIKCGAAWLANAGDKVKYVSYWDSKDSLNEEPKYSSDLFLMVFDFIDEKFETPYSIKELLKN